MPADTPLPPALARVCLFAEKYALPWVYACLAWRQFEFLRADCRSLSAPLPLPPPEWDFRACLLLKHIMVLVLMVFTGGTLLFNRAPAVLPDRLKHVVVPLAMSFYFVLYGVADGLPAEWRGNLLPAGWQLPLALAGLGLSAAGYAISIWAVLTLGRAFALLVAVRQVVLGGPYQYVRHPIYAGYVLDSLGLLLVTASPAMLALVAGFLALLVVRARIEEDRLGAASAEYARYRRRTGFLWPRAWGG